MTLTKSVFQAYKANNNLPHFHNLPFPQLETSADDLPISEAPKNVIASTSNEEKEGVESTFTTVRRGDLVKKTLTIPKDGPIQPPRET